MCPYCDAQNKPAWRDRTSATHHVYLIITIILIFIIIVVLLLLLSWGAACILPGPYTGHLSFMCACQRPVRLPTSLISDPDA